MDAAGGRRLQRRSKSISNIKDMQLKLQRLEDFLFELPSNIKKVPKRLIEKSNEMMAKKRVAQNKMESGEYPKAPFQPKLLAILLLPFLPILVYFLYVFISSLVFFMYMICLFLYFSALVAYFITEPAIRPPWYKPGRDKLSTEQLPAYWQGIWHNPKKDLNLDYEEVEFETKYGAKLRGWFVPAPSNVTNHNIGICFVHGGGRDRRAFLRHVPLFHYQGYDCLLFDFSEHGLSDGSGRGFSYGIREKDDVRFAVKWLKEVKQLKKVVVIGTSVGASSAIMAAAEDETIDAVIAENPVACAEDFALFHLQRMLAVYAPNTYNSIFFMPFYTLVSRVFLFRIGAVFGYNRPYQVIDKISPRPLLLMHGTNDDLVPHEHSQRLLEAAKEPKDLWLAADAWHCALFDLHPEEYGKRVHDFLNKYMHAELIEQKPLHISSQINVVPRRRNSKVMQEDEDSEGGEKEIAETGEKEEQEEKQEKEEKVAEEKKDEDEKKDAVKEEETLAKKAEEGMDIEDEFSDLGD